MQKLIDKHITSDGDVLKVTDLVNIFDKEERQAELEKLTGKAAKADHIASRTLKAISIKWYDDPVESKRLSELIKKTIEDYHQQRINEAEYLAKTIDLEDMFFNGRRNNVPSIIKDNSTAIAFYNLASEEFKDCLASKTNRIDIAAEIASGIDSVVKSNVFDSGHPVIDWQKNDDIKGKMRIEIDDLLFEFSVGCGGYAHGLRDPEHHVDHRWFSGRRVWSHPDEYYVPGHEPHPGKCALRGRGCVGR